MKTFTSHLDTAKAASEPTVRRKLGHHIVYKTNAYAYCKCILGAVVCVLMILSTPGVAETPLPHPPPPGGLEYQQIDTFACILVCKKHYV